MTAIRPCDRASALILAWQDELTALGLLRDASGSGGDRDLTDRAVQPCGTEAAARRHRRRREPLCGPCREAENAASRAREADSGESARVRERDRERLRRWRARQKGAAA